MSGHRYQLATAVDGKTVDCFTSSRTLENTFKKNKTLILQKALMGYQKKNNDAYIFFQHYIYITLLDILLFFMHSYSDAEKNKKTTPPKKKVKLDSSPRRQTERTRHPAAPLAADKRML